MSIFFIAYMITDTGSNTIQVESTIFDDMFSSIDDIIFSVNININDITFLELRYVPGPDIFQLRIGSNSDNEVESFAPFAFTDDDCMVFISGNFPDDTNPTITYVSPNPGVDQLLNLNEGRMLNTMTAIWGTTNCCVHASTIIETNNGSKPISQIKNGDMVKDLNGNYIEVLSNIMFGKDSKYVCVPKDSLGENIPNQDLFATRLHPFLYENKEILFKHLLGKNGIDYSYQPWENVYSLVTADRTYVLMNNVPVATWAKNDWEIHAKENPQIYFKEL